MEKFLFQINFKNFGPLKNAEIELRPLTIFVGPNNTGKTYVAYFIWSIVSQKLLPFMEFLGAPAKIIKYLRENIFKPLKTTKEAKFDFLAFLKEGYLDYFLKKYTSLTSNLFFNFVMRLKNIEANPEIEIKKINEKAIEDKFISLELELEKDQFGEIELTFQKNKKDPFISFTVDKSINRRSFRKGSKKELKVLEDLHNFLMRLLHHLVLRSAIVIPAERTALTITYKDIYQLRAEATFRDRFKFGKFSRYPYPVTNFLNFMYNVLEVPITDHFKEAINHIQTNIIRGKIELRNIKGIDIPSIYYSFFKKQSEEIEIEIHGASSGVKALASLLLYLQRAHPNDLLIIDEPEINLHPEAQLKLIEALNIAVNKGLYVVTTTHTPYIVDCLSNLMKGYLVWQKGEKFRKKLKELGFSQNTLISPDMVSVYWFKEDGTVENILDREDAFIDWRTFSEVTEELERIDFKLEELKYEDTEGISES